MSRSRIFYCEMASYILMALALCLIITQGLVSALLSGMLVYSIVTIFSPRLGLQLDSNKARIVMVGIIGTVIVALLMFLVWGAIVFFKSENGNTQVLLQKLADIIDASKAQCQCGYVHICLKARLSCAKCCHLGCVSIQAKPKY